MAQLGAHGGNCCGMKHIHGFRNGDAQDTISLREQTFIDNRAYANGAYQLEVILSDRQTRDRPQLIAELARTGYVYTSSWTGQHGTPVHLFHRAKRRLALSSAHFYNRWTNELNGMVASPGLAGDLPRAPANAVLVPAPRDRPYGFNQGDEVVIVSPRSRFNGQTSRVVRTEFVNYPTTACVLENGARIVESNLRLVQQAAPPQLDQTVYRHPQLGQNAAVAAPVPERRLILSQFYCVFAATNQASRVFPTLAAGQEAYPRARYWQERKVYSDGEIVQGPVNHG